MKNIYFGSVGKYCNDITTGAEAYNVFNQFIYMSENRNQILIYLLHTTLKFIWNTVIICVTFILL